uniref:Uncharacterized protein n=1 Tax=Arundo donax TaxID=35708 RepID=A0A0A9C009_ARUDO
MRTENALSRLPAPRLKMMLFTFRTCDF